MKLHVNTLILEVTRACNMDCAHCLRGTHAAQNFTEQNPMFITEDILEQILSKLDDIGSIVFTGGEPSLCPNILQKILQLTKKHKLQPFEGFMATNGKYVSDHFIRACDDWQQFILQNNHGYETRYLQPEETCQIIRSYQNNDMETFNVALSIDQYHQPIQSRNLMKLLSKSWFSAIKITEPEKPGHWIARGNAAKPEFPETARHREYNEPYIQIENYDDKPTLDIETLYVTTGGHLYSDCDLSYEDMELIRNSCYDIYLGHSSEDKEDLIERWAELAE